jgi:hypothetical protein
VAAAQGAREVDRAMIPPQAWGGMAVIGRVASGPGPRPGSVERSRDGSPSDLLVEVRRCVEIVDAREDASVCRDGGDRAA